MGLGGKHKPFCRCEIVKDPPIALHRTDLAKHRRPRALYAGSVQQFGVGLPDRDVAAACRSFESAAVDHREVTASVFDHPAALQGTGGSRDADWAGCGQGLDWRLTVDMRAMN